MSGPPQPVPERHLRHAALLLDFHRLEHPPRRCDAAVGLGTFDLGVPAVCAELYHAGLFPTLVLSGGNNSYTAARFPRGEAVHFRDHVMELGVPESAILVEPHATNTGENIIFARRTLRSAGIEPESVLLIAKAARRPFATARKLWPGVEHRCASDRRRLHDYLRSGVDPVPLIGAIVEEHRRVLEYPARGFTVPQEVPQDVQASYAALRHEGYGPGSGREA